MATVYIVELWNCGEREFDPLVFATEELANEYASRYPGWPVKNGPGARVFECEILTELQPIEEQKPESTGGGFTIMADGSVVTDPEELKKIVDGMEITATNGSLRGITGWNKDGLGIPPSILCGTDEVQEYPVYMVQWVPFPNHEWQLRLNWQMELPAVNVRPSWVAGGILSKEMDQRDYCCKVQSVISFAHAWETAKQLVKDTTGCDVELPEYKTVLTQKQKEVANV